jgi:hypothetical protein
LPLSYQRYKARIELDGSIRFAAWACCPLAGGGSAWRPATEGFRAVVRHVRPGESFEGESFAYWRAFLEERGGAAVVEMVTVHEHPPCLPCRGGCPQHPSDDYETMSRVVERWRDLLRKRDRAARRKLR